MTLLPPPIIKLRHVPDQLRPVPDKPVVLAKEEVKYGYIGGTVDLVCQVKAEPAPRFKWSKRVGKSGRLKDFKGEVESENPETSVAKVRVIPEQVALPEMGIS